VIIATVLALLILPLIVLRGRTLVRYYAVDAATWLLAWLLWRRVLDFDPYLAFVALAVVKLATFSLFLAAGANVRWSANRAALVAAVVYSLTVPAMLRTPVDGDEPFYLLVTESIVHDFDLDLANQYAHLERSRSGRTDLVPQFGDPTGPHGERYSRHEPFLPLLMVPGYALGGIYGALATIALFGVLLVRSTIRWMEDEGLSDAAARAVFPLFAFGPPVLFYATRIWPEVPAAFFFVEALRGMREERVKRWLPALLGLVLLKLRFVLVAVGFVASGVLRVARGSVASGVLRVARGSVASGVLRVARGLWRGRRYPVNSPLAMRNVANGHSQRATRNVALGAAILILPLAIMWLVTGSATSVHTWSEILPTPLHRYVTGFSGLLADGMSGIPFQAPFYLFGLFAITRWRATPRGFRLGMLAGSLYVLYLLPRSEWFGGWAPPLRYLVFLMPVLALGAASIWDRISRGAMAVVSAWTIALVIHGLAYPWRLFHIANGENAIGEWLSTLTLVDYSRFFPSFIRMNGAAWIGAGAVALIVAFGLQRPRRIESGSSVAALQVSVLALALGLGAHFARRPPSHVELEDAHVVNKGGRLYPDVYTIMRVAYDGGRVLDKGDSLSFLAREGTWTLRAITGLGATVEIAGQSLRIAPDPRYQSFKVTIPKSGRVTLRCVSGAVNVDRLDRVEGQDDGR
jgi:hypothetical protein